MLKLGLGVDCSGLAYYVLSHWLRQAYGLRLSDHLYIPKADIIKASRKPTWQKAGVSQSQLKKLPSMVSVSEVCHLFHRHPMHITNVARLTSQESAQTISRTSQAKPGDMIKMTGLSGDHIAVILKVYGSTIRYVDSRETGDSGRGVRFQDIKIIDPKAGLDKQDWPDRTHFNPGVGDRLCRLRVINERK